MTTTGTNQLHSKKSFAIAARYYTRYSKTFRQVNNIFYSRYEILKLFLF